MRLATDRLIAPMIRSARQALAAVRPRQAVAGSVDTLALSAAARAPRPARLPAERTYRALLARQARGEAVDVKRLTRPGIVGWAEGGRKPWAIIQGAGRYEKIPASGYFDAFLDARAPLPPGAIPLEGGVPGSLVYAANVLSSRGKAGANPELVEFVTAGRTFRRALFPAQALGASTSKVLHEVARHEALLAQRLGAEALQQRLPAGYAASSPIERLEALQRLVSGATGA